MTQSSIHVRVFLWSIVAITLLSVTGSYVWSAWQQARQQATGSRQQKEAAGSGLEVLGELPAFRFPSHTGQPVGIDDLRGSVWVAEFFFTSCAGICPIMNKNMTQVQAAFAENPAVKIVSFTVDPQTDTVPILRAYSKNWHAKPGQWFFVTGDKKVIYRLAREGFKLETAEVPPQEQGGPRDFIHSNRFVLVDRLGRIRGYYTGTEEADVQRLIADIRQLLQERG